MLLCRIVLCIPVFIVEERDSFILQYSIYSFYTAIIYSDFSAKCTVALF